MKGVHSYVFILISYVFILKSPGWFNLHLYWQPSRALCLAKLTEQEEITALVLFSLRSFFSKNIFYNNIEGESREILRIY